MKVMEEKVRSIQMEGLEWKGNQTRNKQTYTNTNTQHKNKTASKLVAIGYGIKKLAISCHVVDDKVSVDDIQEKIQVFFFLFFI
jgi:elongation factor 1-beta